MAKPATPPRKPVREAPSPQSSGKDARDAVADADADGDSPRTFTKAPASIWSAHFGDRMDGLSSAILVIPLFLIYQLGILTQRGLNGVDLLTKNLVALCERDLDAYLMVLGVVGVAYAMVLVLLWKRGTFDPRSFLPMLAESSVYALTMGTLIVFIMSQFSQLSFGLTVGQIWPCPEALNAAPQSLSVGGSFGDIVVISAGAGLHEELVFRLLGMGGMIWLLSALTGEARAWVIAFIVSSLAFSLAHHVVPGGEPFTMTAFTYRALAGAFFATVYQLRGFAVAAWTHALYDVYVLSSQA